MERADRPGLIYNPTVERRSATLFRLTGMRDNETVVPWGLWGGVFAAAIGVFIIAYEGVTGLWAIWDLAWAIAAIAFGLMLVRFGRFSSLDPEPCAEIDLATRKLRLTSSQDVALPEVDLEDITEVVYGMTTYPVSTAPGAVRVQAFSLLVRYGSSTLLPVVEASPDKDELYLMARFISQVTRAPITQVGLGVRS